MRSEMRIWMNLCVYYVNKVIRREEALCGFVNNWTMLTKIILILLVDKKWARSVKSIEKLVFWSLWYLKCYYDYNSFSKYEKLAQSIIHVELRPKSCFLHCQRKWMHEFLTMKLSKVDFGIVILHLMILQF